jgi:hypothetical protein
LHVKLALRLNIKHIVHQLHISVILDLFKFDGSIFSAFVNECNFIFFIAGSAYKA